MDNDAEDVRLNEFSKDEWWDVMRIAKPGLTKVEFEAAWTEFEQVKRQRALH